MNMDRARVCFLTLIWALFSCFSLIHAQDTTGKGGLERFKDKDFAGAIQLLKNSKDPIDARIVAMSYEGLGKRKEAIRAFDLSFKSGYSLFDDAFQKWTKDKGGKSFLALLSNLSEVISASLSSAESVLRLGGKADVDNEWRHKANILFDLQKIAESSTEFYRSSDLDTPMTILKRSRPLISANICVDRANLDVILQFQVLFHPDGKTVTVIPASKWKKNCHESSVLSAINMTFDPGLKDGKQVGTIKMIEYSFSVR